MTIPSALSTALADRYRIERELGAGGMATVYLAEDLKHHRRVAIKVLRPELSALVGTDRFLKEIEVTARLQHPHLLPLFDSGAAAGLLFYVMPYVAGESLREKLRRERQLGVDEAVRITTQVASALEHAHRQGVIHRDIKPENILLSEGQALVADFGIALALRQAGGTRLTDTGLSLGTPQYMSPEQTTGERELDARSDVFSLACVLYEMLVGEPPHSGPTMQAILARVMTERPRALTEQRHAVPWWVEEAVLRALEKLPADRFASPAEFAAALAAPASPGGRTRDHRALRAAPRPAVLIGGAAALVAGGVLGGALLAGRAGDDGLAADAPVHRTTILLPDSIPMAFVGEAPLHIGRRALDLSPDGRTLVYVGWYRGRTHLFVRALDDERVRHLPGTEGAYGPFFAPNGRWVAFLAGGAIKKVPLDGGQPVELGDAQAVQGGVWLEDGRLILGGSDALAPRTLAETGGDTRPLEIPFRGACDWCRFVWSDAWDASRLAASADLGTWVLSFRDGDVSGAEIGPAGLRRPRTDLPLKSQRPLGPAGSPQFLAEDLLLVADDGRLHAVAFDPRTLAGRGAPIPLDELVRQETFGWGAQFATSRDGTLVYASGRNVERSVLLSADRSGRVDTLPFEPARYWNPAVSPDGRRIAITVRVARGFELQVLHLPTRTRVVALASDRGLFDPVWSADGSRIALYSDSSSASFEVLASGGQARTVPEKMVISARSRDGRWTAMGDSLPYVVDSAGRRSIAQGFIYIGDFSPDGRWAVGMAAGRGYDGVVMTALPIGGPVFSIVAKGCAEPYFMPSGRELACLGDDGLIYAVPLQFEGSEVRGLPRRRLTSVPALPAMGNKWSLSRDGQRMVFVAGPAVDTTTRLTVVTNFRAVVERKARETRGEPAPR